MQGRAWRNCAGHIVPTERLGRAVGESYVAEAAALQTQGQACHLFVSSGRAESSRIVRQQTGADEVRRKIATGGVVERLPLSVHHAELEPARAEVQIQKVRPIRRGTFRTLA